MSARRMIHLHPVSGQEVKAVIVSAMSKYFMV
jgi:hypothetical protein